MSFATRSSARPFSALTSFKLPFTDRYARFSSAVSPAPEPTPAVQADPQLRLSAIKLYKERLILEPLAAMLTTSPDPAYEFNKRLRRVFEKNAKLTSADDVRAQLAMGEHVKKEILAMLSLKKFRHLRRTYYPNDGPR